MLDRLRLMLVTDLSLCPPERLPALVSAVVAHGVDGVQLRAKELPPADLRVLAGELRRVTAGRALLFVNGIADVALDCRADGVQLGEAAAGVAEVRRQAGTRLLIGRSVHSLDAALTAARDGADLLVLGTIYPSRSHPGGVTAGPALVARVTAATALPVIAIGGITAANAAEVIQAGATGIAVISAILSAADPAGAAAALRAAIDGGLAHPARDPASAQPITRSVSP